MTTAAATTARRDEPLLLALTADGRIASEAAFERLQQRVPSATDCFVFCHGWLYDEQEARRAGARFFALLDAALHALGDRVAPFHLVLHWPSKPFADPGLTRGDGAGGLWPELERMLAAPARRGASDMDRVLVDLCAGEIPLSPEEEVELEALLRRLTGRQNRGALALLPFHALSFWVMKRRAGAVGERFGREHLAPFWDALPCGRPRLHLVGHSFGAKLLTSAVLGGVHPKSLTLLQAAFSAFAFAPEVPGFDRPGFDHRVLAEEQVRGPIVILRSIHDAALRILYPAVTGSGEADRSSTSKTGTNGDGGSGMPGRWGYMKQVVATSALGAVGARGVGATEVDLLEAQFTGIPRQPIVNVDGSKLLLGAGEPFGAHSDIHHPEVAALVLMAAGLLEGGPEGARPRRLNPLDVA